MTPRKMIIAISALANSGKDTVADMLVEDHGFCKVSLADPLKQIARNVYAFTDLQLWGSSQFRNAGDPRYPRSNGTLLSPREALQKLGTEWGRSCFEDTWAILCIRVAQTLMGQAGYDYSQKFGLTFVDVEGVKPGVVVPDCRFRNEMALIKAAGGMVIRIVRPGAGLGGAAGLHPSEVEQASIPDSEFDAVIQNDGSLDDLRNSINALVGDF